jgi:hypothetical protein
MTRSESNHGAFGPYAPLKPKVTLPPLFVGQHLDKRATRLRRTGAISTADYAQQVLAILHRRYARRSIVRPQLRTSEQLCRHDGLRAGDGRQRSVQNPATR